MVNETSLTGEEMGNTLFLRLFTDKIIQTKTEPVEIFDDSLLELAGKMIGSMKFNRGAGLSANQVGVSKRLCVVSLEDGTNDMVLVNPYITEKSGKKIASVEGCLSAPKVFPTIKRFEKIKVVYQTVNGDKKEMNLEGFDARIIQHEVDHLAGKTIIDTFRKIPTF